MRTDDTTEAQPAKADEAPQQPAPKQRRGFAAMDRARVREISKKGGVAAHRKGTAHRFSHDEARQAGRKGGLAPHRTRGRTSEQPPAEVAAEHP